MHETQIPERPDSKSGSDAAPSDPQDGKLTEGTLVGERYRVLHPLGEGAMGTVYLCEHISLRKKVALKLLHRELCSVPEVVTRFEREAIAAGNIDHPNIAAASDFGSLGSQFYLVLEYIEGVSLRQLLDNGALSLPRTLKIVKQVCAALVRAHSLGIVHRDLKPDNVMLLDREGEPDFVKVLDFGIARVPMQGDTAGPALTRAGMIYGTPEYMAPEQALGAEVDARADLYALGIMIFEMAAGARPFAAESMVKLLGMHIGVAPPKLSEKLPDAAPEWSALIDRLLAKDRADRFASAKDLLFAMEALETQRASKPEAEPLPAAAAEPAPERSPVDNSVTRAATERPPADPVVTGATDGPKQTGEGLSPKAWILQQLATPAERRIAWAKEHALLVLGASGIAAMLVLATLIFAFRGGTKEVQQSGRGPSSAKGEVDKQAVYQTFEAGQIDKAEGMLRTLDPKEAQSSEVLASRMKGLIKTGNLAGALATLRDLEARDAKRAAAPDLLVFHRAVLIPAPSTQDSDAGAERSGELVEPSLRLLEAHPTAEGADLIYEAAYSGTLSSKPIRDRLRAALKNKGIADVASQGLQTAIKLRDLGASCKVIAEVPAAIETGDARTIAIFQELKKTKNMVQTKKLFFKSSLVDTLACLRKDDVLGKAIAEMEAKQGK
jgi:eukaryotic-like serine/threonine-protein kinase